MALRLEGSWLCRRCHSPIARSVAPASRRGGLQNSDRIQSRRIGHIAPAGSQASPLKGFYADILSEPIYSVRKTRSTEITQTEKEKTLEKARVVFGSRLAGPGERSEAKKQKSTLIAGILVPPRPMEPDNCCMSGCVNCVWDLYRDDMEEWAAKSAEARAKLQALRSSGDATGTMLTKPGTPSHVATSMDDDGGGSDTNWANATSPGADGDMFADIPVGIREFMKTEKMLKQKHAQESASAS